MKFKSSIFANILVLCKKIFYWLWQVTKLLIIIVVFCRTIPIVWGYLVQYVPIYDNVFVEKWNTDGSITKVEVPYDIVRRRDCFEYTKWVSINLSQSLASLEACPWDNRESRVINTIVGKEVFSIPLRYIVTEKHIPAKRKDFVAVVVKYPEMTYATQPDYGELGMVILALGSQHSQNVENKQANESLNLYKILTHITTNSVVNIPNKIEKIRELPEENWTEYEINGGRYFVRGDPLEPTAWLQFYPAESDMISACGSVVHYEGDIYVHYRTDTNKALSHYDEIQQKIIDKVRSWHKREK